MIRKLAVIFTSLCIKMRQIKCCPVLLPGTASPAGGKKGELNQGARVGKVFLVRSSRPRASSVLKRLHLRP